MKPIRINYEAGTEGVPASEGVYKIIAVDQGGNPIKINRIICPDDEGILYIGKSQDIAWRLGDFVKTILESYKFEGHSGGTLYNLSEPIRKAYPRESLAISFDLCKESRENEKKEMLKYLLKYGEFPPLNSSF